MSSTEVQTVQKLIDKLQELLKIKPEAANWPIIYSSDDEGNSYHKIWFDPNFTQVEDIDERYLEVVGHYDETKDNIALEDCNCVIIN